MTKGIQVIGMIVGIYLIAQTYINFKNGSNNIKRTIFWLFLWSAMIIIFLDPSLSELALPILSTQDAKISVIVLAILTIFIFIVHIWQHINKMEHMIVELTQNLAINDYMKAFRKKVNDDIDR